MAGLHEAEICLRVVGLVPQEGKQDSTCAGFFDRLFRRLDSHKNRVDPRQTGERRLDFLDLVAICGAPRAGQGLVTRGWSRQAGMVAM